MKKSISEIFAACKAEVAYRTDRTQAGDLMYSSTVLPGEPQLAVSPMEFATFLQAMITIPAQIICSGRQTIVRLLNVNDWTATFFRLTEQPRPVRYAPWEREYANGECAKYARRE